MNERKWLRIARQNKGLTQKQLAEKIDISEEYYSQIEDGERQKKMDSSLVRRLSTALDISVPEIINLEELDVYYIVDEDTVVEFEEALAIIECVLSSSASYETKKDAYSGARSLLRHICDKVESSELIPKYKKQLQDISA